VSRVCPRRGRPRPRPGANGIGVASFLEYASNLDRMSEDLAITTGDSLRRDTASTAERRAARLWLAGCVAATAAIALVSNGPTMTTT